MSLPFRDPFIGSVVDGKYQVMECLGSGGMGTVYKALHISLGAPRALKVMRPELAGDATLAARFRTEARLAEGLRHPHLVALYDFGQLPGGGCYIVSELVEGATLAALLQRRGSRFRSADVALFVGQLADGLSLAHRRGVVHRDISPDNVMLTAADDRVAAKLLDFGIAKDTLNPPPDARTGLGWNVGKIGFSSPEQMGALRAGEVIDGRSDLFSLAAVGYVMLTGRLPWRRDSVQGYMHDLLVRPEADTRAEIRQHVPAAWRDLFAVALARSRDARYPDVLAFKEALAEAVRSLDGVDGEVPPFQPDMLRSGRRGSGTGPLATQTLSTPAVAPAIPERPPSPPRPEGRAAPPRPAGAVITPSAMLLEDMASADQPRVDPRPRRIVILDDDDALRAVVPSLLAGSDLEVATAAWPARQHCAEAGRLDLLLVDPGAGDDAAEGRLRQLREEALFGAVPFVVFSSSDEWTLRSLARRTGAVGHLPKDVLAGDFVGAVRRFLAVT